MSSAGASADADQLIEAAHGVGERSSHDPFDRSSGSAIGNFVDALRAWLIEHYDLPGQHDERLERTRLLLYLMVGATTLGEALGLLARFRKLVWGDRSIRLIDDRDDIQVVLEQPAGTDVPGLLSDLWSLSFLLAELEFLAGGALDGAVGCVRQAECLSASTVKLLFARPLSYKADVLVLILPRRHWARAVVARPSQIGDFVARLVPRAVGASQTTQALSIVVAGMIRAETSAKSTPMTLERVATLLGLSAATLRRRLAREGMTFRTIKENVLDELAKIHLAADMSVEETAARLGYSDAYAFRRAFQHRQRCTPSAYKQKVGAGQL